MCLLASKARNHTPQAKQGANKTQFGQKCYEKGTMYPVKQILAPLGQSGISSPLQVTT
jgi:hypothetical protein